MPPDDGDAHFPRVGARDLSDKRLCPHNIQRGDAKELGRVKSPGAFEHLDGRGGKEGDVGGGLAGSKVPSRLNTWRGGAERKEM